MRQTSYNLCSLLLSLLLATSPLAQELPGSTFGVLGTGELRNVLPIGPFPGSPGVDPRPTIGTPFTINEQLERLIKRYEREDPYLLLLRRPFLAAPQDEHLSVVTGWSKKLEGLPLLKLEVIPPRSVRRSGDIDDAFLSKASSFIEDSRIYSSNIPTLVAKLNLLQDLKDALPLLRSISNAFTEYYLAYMQSDDPLLIRLPSGGLVPQLSPLVEGNINWYPQYEYIIQLSRTLLSDDVVDRALLPCVLDCSESSPIGISLFVWGRSSFTLPMHQARDEMGYWVLLRSGAWERALERFGDIAKVQIGLSRTALGVDLQNLTTVASNLRIVLSDLDEEVAANKQRLKRLAGLADTVRGYKRAAEATLENVQSNSRRRKNLIINLERKAEELEQLTDKLEAGLETIENRITEIEGEIETLEDSYPRNGEQIFKLTEKLAVAKGQYREVKGQVRKTIADRRSMVQQLRRLRSAEGRVFPLVIRVSEAILEHQKKLDQNASEATFRRDRLVNMDAAAAEGMQLQERLLLWLDEAPAVLFREIGSK